MNINVHQNAADSVITWERTGHVKIGYCIGHNFEHGCVIFGNSTYMSTVKRFESPHNYDLFIIWLGLEFVPNKVGILRHVRKFMIVYIICYL